MLRLAPWLVLSGFKTDGWPPVPIPKASPGPNCRWSWLLPCCGWRPGWFYRVSKLTDGPRSRSQRPPQAQNVFGAGFSGALATFIGFQNWRMAPVPIPKASPGPKCSWSWLLPCCGWRPGWFYRVSKLTDGPLSRSQRPPQAQNVFGAGFSHAAAGALAGFVGFQNWWPPVPIPKASPRPKCSWSWL